MCTRPAAVVQISAVKFASTYTQEADKASLRCKGLLIPEEFLPMGGVVH
jgi:hypothetical protein